MISLHIYGSNPQTLTHSAKCWAVDITHSLLISEPPQKRLPFLHTLACQGQLLGAASCPVTLWGLSGVVPQTDKNNIASKKALLPEGYDKNRPTWLVLTFSRFCIWGGVQATVQGKHRCCQSPPQWRKMRQSLVDCPGSWSWSRPDSGRLLNKQ